MKLLAAILLAGALVATAGHPATAADAAAPPLARFSATGYWYIVPHAPDFAMGIAAADLSWLHLEGRYNYEALHTGSVFLGLTGGWGTALRLNLTPMAGAVFGRLDGIAPALRLTVTWWRFDLFSESEVVVPFSDLGDSFFYDWSELGFTLFRGLRFGGALQRTLVFETSLAIQRGLFAGLALGPFNFTFYEFNAGWISPTYVAALGVTL